MLRKIKYHLLITITSLTLTMPVFIPLQASACNAIGNAAASGIAVATGGSGINCGQGSGISQGIGSIAKTVVNIFSIVVGVISVIMIIYAGFRYVTSGGDSNSVTSARNTLIYAVVGLIIVAISQLIVHYVLNTGAAIQAGTTPNP